MDRQIPKKVLAALFLFLYMPFLYEHGVRIMFTESVDFPSFYWAVKLVFEQHLSPFTTDAFAGLKAEFGQSIYPYLYPPPSLLAFYPLRFMSYRAARLAMLCLNHVCVLAFLYVFLIKIQKIGTWKGRQLYAVGLSIIYVIAFHSIIVNLEHGQINLVVLIFIVLSWYGVKDEHGAMSVGVPLSLAILLKTYPVLLLPLLVIRKRYDAVILTGGLLILYGVISYFVLPTIIWSDWYRNILPTGGYGQTPFGLDANIAFSNLTINGFTSRMFVVNTYGEALWYNPSVGRLLAYMLSTGMVGVTIVLSFVCSRKLDSMLSVDLQFSLFLLMMFLVAPLSWDHHLVFILPSALLAFYLVTRLTANRIMQTFVIASLFLIAWRLPSVYWTATKGILPTGISIKFYAVTVLWLFTAMMMRRLTIRAVSEASSA